MLLDDAGARWPAPAPLAEVARTLVVVGDTRDPALGERAAAWAAERGHPLVAEPFGSAVVRAEAVPHGPLLLTATDWLDAHAPDRVVVVGRPTLSRAVGALLRRPGLRVEVVSEGGQWPDPSHVASAVHPPHALRLGGPTAPDDDHGWSESWRSRSDAARGCRCRATVPVAQRPRRRRAPWSTGSPATPCSSSARATRCATSTSPWPGRSPTRCWPTGAWPASTAWSPRRSASPWPEPAAPTYALLGDLTFLHDANGLLIGPDEPTPDLTLVVVNDDGGGIFTTLEHGAPERAADFERVFGTPTGTDLGALCRAHGIRHDLRRPTLPT